MSQLGAQKLVIMKAGHDGTGTAELNEHEVVTS